MECSIRIQRHWVNIDKVKLRRLGVFASSVYFTRASWCLSSLLMRVKLQLSQRHLRRSWRGWHTWNSWLSS